MPLLTNSFGFLAAGPGVRTGLPYPPLSEEVRLIIDRAVCWAWATLLERTSIAGIYSVGEIAITEGLQTILNQAMNDANGPVAGFTAKYFETIERGAEITNVDGTKLEKRPDLRFRLLGRQDVSDRVFYALFVECKIVDAMHSIERYCKDGLLRFLRGDYAWAMTHSMMLAYVRDSGVSLEHLRAYLAENAAFYGVVEISHAEYNGTVGMLDSIHVRTWVYPMSLIQASDIQVAHRWLTVQSGN